MKNYLIYYLLITLSIIVNSCSEGFKEEYLKISIVLKEVTAITTPTTDTTPDYTFSSTESGAITYGGSCSSSTTSAISGNNTITLSSLSDGTYADCTIKVSKTLTTNKSKTNLSGSLTITSFTVDSTTSTLTEVTAVTTPTNDTTPDYTFSSTKAGTITYGGSCSSGTTSATTDNNTITLVSLTEDTYSNCTITVTDNSSNSVTLNMSSFVIDTTAPTVSSVSTTADNQSSVAITDNITVTFSEAMDNTSVTTNSDNASCSGTLRVSSDNFSGCVQMSSVPASSTDNKTFTLDPYDNLTVSTTYKTRVTTGVKDTAGNALSSQYETSSGFTTGDNWQLIARQADINEQEFDSGAKTSFLEHEDDPDNSTFMSIGNLTASNYVSDGKYKFKLVWGGETNVDDLSIKEIIWTQTSWLTDDTTVVEGLQEIPDNDTSGFIDDRASSFDGLLKSTSDCVLDGNEGGPWYHCIGMARGQWHGGIPGPRSKIATSMHLYIWATESSTQMGGSIQGVEPDLSTAVTTFAGSSQGYTNDTGTSAEFNFPRGITTDGTNLYVADQNNHKIRKIVITTGVVTILAGSTSGTPSDSKGNTDATGTSARFDNPVGITTDGTNLYVTDTDNERIRKIVISTGVVTTLAGSSQGSTDATGTSARFDNPIGITTDGTNLYVADKGNHRIRKIVISTGVVTTLAGSSEGSTDATGTSARFNTPLGITTDGTNLYVADYGNDRIRKIVISTGVVTTLAGSSEGSTDATGTSARFNNPVGITTDGTNLYVADKGNHRIRKIVISTGVVTTLAGSSSGSTNHNTGTSARFNAPQGITTDGTNLYVSDNGNHRIRKIE